MSDNGRTIEIIIYLNVVNILFASLLRKKLLQLMIDSYVHNYVDWQDSLSPSDMPHVKGLG